MSVISVVNSIFNNYALRKFFLFLRKPLSVAAVLAVTWYADPRWFWPAAAVSLVGAALQWWCFSCIKTSKELAVNGPYLFVRNPMYLARSILVLGFVMLTGSIWALAAFVVLYYLYMYNRTRREELKLAEIFGESYREYCRLVPRFLPSLKPYHTGRLLYFRMECFKRNNGFTNIVAVLAGWALIYALVFIWRLEVWVPKLLKCCG